MFLQKHRAFVPQAGVETRQLDCEHLYPTRVRKGKRALSIWYVKQHCRLADPLVAAAKNS